MRLDSDWSPHAAKRASTLMQSVDSNTEHRIQSREIPLAVFVPAEARLYNCDLIETYERVPLGHRNSQKRQISRDRQLGRLP